MLLINLLNFIKMFCNKETRAFFKKVHAMLKDDPAYSVGKVSKALYPLLKMDKMVNINGKYYMNFTIPPIPSEAFFTFLKATKHPDSLFSQHALLQKSAPATICLSVTDACAYNCYYCSNHGKVRGNELTTQEWLKVIQDLQDMNTSTLFFTGGEPLFKEDLELLIREVDQRSMTYLLTSGQGFTRERARTLKESGLYGVSVSLDSYDPKIDNHMRGHNDSYENAVSAIKIAGEMGFCTTMISVIPKTGVIEEELFKLFRFAKSLGAKEITLKEPVRTGSLYDSVEDVFYNDQDRERLVKIQRKANARLKGFKVTTEIEVSNYQVFGCVAGIQHAYINNTGELFPCDFAPLSFGNVRDEGIKAVWKRMNTAVGLPKKKCLADEAYFKLKEKGVKTFPTPPAISCEICAELAENEYPRFNRILQGE